MDKWNYKNADIEEFDTIYIETKTADVNIVAGKDGKFGVDISMLGDESTVEFVNENGTLSLKDTGSDLGFVISMFSWDSSFDNTITIYYPEDVLLDSINVTCNAGDIDVSNINGAEALNIVADAGYINGNVYVDANVGDIDIDTSISVEDFKYDISMDLGDIEAFGKDVEGFEGKLTGNLNGQYIMHLKTNIGDITVE